jgi:O-antigen ligase
MDVAVPRHKAFPGKTAQPARSGHTGETSFQAVWFGSVWSWSIPFLIAVLIAFNHFGRPFEKFLTGFKIPLVLCSIGIVIAFVNRPQESTRHRIIRLILAMVVWMTISAFFSVWRTGSALYVKEWASLWPAFTILLAMSPVSFNHVKMLLWVVSASCAFHLINGASEYAGRMSLSGTFGNADDVALLAGFALPLATLFALNFRNTMVRYVLLAGMAIFFLRAIGATATRAAIPALLGVMALYFVRLGATQRLALVFSAVIGMFGLIAILPSSALERLATITDTLDSDVIAASASKDEAYGSTAERKDLMYDAIRITFENPLFGAGPGEFGDYRNRFFKRADGRGKRIIPSHNTYLQIASEIGLPGLLLYCLFLVAIWKSLQRSRKYNQPGSHPDWQTGDTILMCLEAAYVYFVICALFMTCDKHPHVFVLAGTAVAMERISLSYVRQFAAARAATPATPAPAKAVPRGMAFLRNSMRAARLQTSE